MKRREAFGRCTSGPSFYMSFSIIESNIYHHLKFNKLLNRRSEIILTFQIRETFSSQTLQGYKFSLVTFAHSLMWMWLFFSFQRLIVFFKCLLFPNSRKVHYLNSDLILFHILLAFILILLLMRSEHNIPKPDLVAFKRY